MKNCTWVQDHLNDYVDGDLTATDVEEMERHLQNCSRCQEEYDALRALLDQAGALPKHIQPERDLWPGIAPQLTSRATIDWRRHARTAAFAAAVAALVVVAVSMGLLQAPEVPEAPVVVSVHYPEPLQSDRSEMRDAYRARAETLDPELRSVIDSNLTIIDQSLDELRHAMELAPNNPRLERMFLTACRSELDMLQQVVQLGQEG